MADASLLFKIKGDSSDAVKAFKDVEVTAKGSVDGLTAAFTKGTFAGNLLHDAVTKITASVISLGPALLNLAKNAATYGAEINDAAQKTNVGTDSLQAFKFAAEASGESFETITKSLGKFSVLLGDAENNNKKAEKTLAAYNITATNTEDALKQAIEYIGNLSTAEEQNAAAAELFKDKSGAMIQVMREMGFSVDGTLDKLKDLGGYMDSEAIKAAAAYDKQLDELDKQLGFVGQTIGKELIPVLIDLSREFSTFLKENKAEIKGWGEYIADSMRRGVLATQSMYTSVQALGEALAQIVKPSWERDFTKFWELVAKADELEAQRAQVGIGPRPVPPSGTGRYRVIPGVNDQPTHRIDVDELAKQAEEARKAREEAAKRDLAAQKVFQNLQIKSMREHYEDVQAAAEKAFIDRDITEKEFLAKSNKALAAYKENTRLYLNRAYDIDVVGKRELEITNLRIERDQDLLAINRQIYRQRDDNAKLIETRNKKEVDEHKKKIASWNKMVDAIRGVYEEESRLDDKQRKDEDERHEKAIKHWNERIKKMQEAAEIQDQGGAAQRKQERKKIESAGGPLLKGIDQGLGTAGEFSIFDPLDQIKSATQVTEDAYNHMKDVAGQAIGSMINGLVDLAAQWILTGEFSAKAALQMAAGVALGVAKEALMLGLSEVAKGIAAQATTWGVPNPASIGHFAAAKVFFATAAIAGAAGVGLAVGARAAGGGAGAGSSSSPSDLTRQEEKNVTPISRYGPMSGASGNPIVNAVQASLDRHAAATEALNAKISSMQPHEVMTRAENQRPGITATHAVNGISSNGGLGTRLARVQGARR